MAVLTGDDFDAIRNILSEDATAFAEIKASSLSKTDWRAALQAVEDRFENDRANYKTDMETAAGTAITNALAKKMVKAWMANKWGGE